MKMECSGKREIRGEVKKEWSLEEWKSVEEKEASVVKREDKIGENEMHVSKRSSFTMNGRLIRCSEECQSWIIDRELKSVRLLSHIIFLYYNSIMNVYCFLFVGSISIVCNDFYYYL